MSADAVESIASADSNRHAVTGRQFLLVRCLPARHSRRAPAPGRDVTAAAPGYSGTPLARKLGIAPAAEVMVIGAPHEYPQWLAPLPASVSFSGRASEKTTIVHLFLTERSELARHLERLRGSLDPDVPIWVSWPKKASKVATTITEDVIREVALPLGYVDVKVCAVSDVWSGLKLVVRKELRKR